MAVDVAALRSDLYRAVDAVLERHFAPADDLGLTVTPEEMQEEWTYRWPSGQLETYPAGHWYRVRAGSKAPRRFLVARTERVAWGRSRGRSVIYLQTGGAGSTRYPCAEFVETDKASTYAAALIDPDHPRASLAEGDPLPAMWARANVQRADALFTTIRSGPSLRLVVPVDDEEAMVRYGYWVAECRKRL